MSGMHPLNLAFIIQSFQNFVNHLSPIIYHFHIVFATFLQILYRYRNITFRDISLSEFRAFNTGMVIPNSGNNTHRLEAKDMAKSVNQIIESSEAKRRAAIERMWLNHFNNGLLEQGLISPEQHRKMKLQIATRKPEAPSR